MNLIIRKVVH